MSEHVFEVESGKTIRLPTKGKRCEKDIIVTAKGGSGDDFWDWYLDVDTHRSMTNAFFGAKWTDETFKPPKPIKFIPNAVINPERNVNNVFQLCKITDLAECLLKSCGQTEMDLLEGGSLGQWFANSTVTRVPKIIFGKSSNPVNLFLTAAELETIDEVAFPYGMNVGINFLNCNALKNLTASGVWDKNTNAQSCPLTAESAKSILLACKDFTGTANEFKWSVTFSPTTLEYLEAEGATAPNGLTWLEYASSKGWNI